MDYKEAIETLRIGGGLEITGNLRRVAEFFKGLKVAVSAMQELMEYKQLGTLEEVREAVEKQKVDKVIESDYMGSLEVWYRCPNCKGDLTHIRGFFCPYCGKRLDWRCDEE